MTTTIVVIALAAAGFVLSRTRFARELGSRRFMPPIYAAAGVYFGVRAYRAIAGDARVWPHILLAILFLGGAIESARKSGMIFGRS